MSNIRIEVLTTDRPAGENGAPGVPPAVVAIRVHGDVPLSADPTFRIDPIDDSLLDDANGGWPSGPRRPIEMRKGDGHVDYVLGADVLDSPLLEAGTPVAITVPGLPAGVEILWPELPMRSSRPRRPVILTAKLREAELRERQAAAREAEEKRQEAISLAAAEAEARRKEAATLAALRGQQTDASLPRVANGDTTENTAVSVGRRRRGHLVPVESGTAPVEHLRLVPAADTSSAALTKLSSTSAVVPPAPAEGLFEARNAWLAFAAGLGTALALVVALAAFRVLPLNIATDRSAAPDIALAAARSSGSLRSLLATSGTSPRGRPAAGIDAVTALALADRHLHGVDLPRDQGEASFWLRHSLSLPLEPESMRWALTQLGTLHAAADGFDPDYAKARLLWEVSSALGDPVAMCFNASLYEYGLGVAKHKSLANALYERARNAGGCPGLDEALARTK